MSDAVDRLPPGLQLQVLGANKVVHYRLGEGMRQRGAVKKTK